VPRYLKSAPTAADRPKGGESTADIVATVIADVRSRGDVAVREYSEKFDKWSPDSFRLDRERIEEIVSRVPGQVVDDIRTVQANVRSFAQHQRDSLRDFEVETMPGVFLGQRNLPVSAAGVYVPGGRYPLVASAHMTVVTAKVAGVPQVLACTPPIRGEIPAATIAAMSMAGADEIYLLGGVQAVAAMAVGTETIDQVDMLAGPGNAYVAEAKRQLLGRLASTCSPGRPRSWSSPMTTPTRSSSPSIYSARPSMVRTRRPSSSPPPNRSRSPRWRISTGYCRPCQLVTSPNQLGATTARSSSSMTSRRHSRWRTRSQASTSRC